MPQSTIYREVEFMPVAERAVGVYYSDPVVGVRSAAGYILQTHVTALDGGAGLSVRSEWSFDGGESWYDANISTNGIASIGDYYNYLGNVYGDTLIPRTMRTKATVTTGNVTFGVTAGICDSPAKDFYREFDILPIAERSASGVGDAIDLGDGQVALIIVNAPITAIAGTSPTLAVDVEQSTDGGTTWTDYATWSGAATVSVPEISEASNLPIARLVRAVWTLGGTDPVVTFGVKMAISAF
jgi:hypothetical protein